MTLNIALVADGNVYQSSDFRVADADSGRPKHDDEPKQILVASPKTFTASISYTGVAEWRGTRTSAWLRRTLTHPFDDAKRFEVVASELAAEATDWFRRVPDRHRPHTFTMAGLVQARNASPPV